MPNVKRRDNTKRFMKDLKKATAGALEEAASRLMKLSKQAVSRPYAGKKRRRDD